MVRAYLPLAERQDQAAGGNYSLSFKTAGITDNSPPVVTDAGFQYQVASTGVWFSTDQDVTGSVDVSDVEVRSLDTNTLYAAASKFYDAATRQRGSVSISASSRAAKKSLARLQSTMASRFQRFRSRGPL